MILEHHIENKKEILKWVSNHPDKEVFNKFSRFCRIINEEEFKTLSKDELSSTKEFIDFNKSNNEFYKNGIDLIEISDDIPNEVSEWLRTMKIREYFKKKYYLLDIFYNTYIDRISRNDKLKQLGI